MPRQHRPTEQSWRVRTDPHDEPDLDKLSQALIRLAGQRADRARQDHGSSSPSTTPLSPDFRREAEEDGYN